jgi:hypothetical protein
VPSSTWYVKWIVRVILCTMLTCGPPSGKKDAIVLQKNHTIYDLPPGIVVEMFSDEYCTGDATLVSHDRCMRLGFDEWQGGTTTCPSNTRRWLLAERALDLWQSPSILNASASDANRQSAQAPSAKTAANT